MQENNYITEQQYHEAIEEPDHAFYHGAQLDFNAPMSVKLCTNSCSKTLGNRSILKGLLSLQPLTVIYKKVPKNPYKNTSISTKKHDVK